MNARGLHTLRMLAQRLYHFGVSASWLRAEAEAGRLPCLRVGKRLLFDPEAVEAELIRRAAQKPKGGGDEPEPKE